VPINFHELIGDGGEAGAREKFEQLINQLAYVKHRALGVLAKPGDWGIDAFVGEFDGMVGVWQAKFFLRGVDEAQKKQIRESFSSALAASKREGHRLEAWTLAFPSTFDGDGWKWWQNWKRKQEKAHDLVIEVWTDTVLESLLLSPDAINVARHYFPNSVAGGPAGTIAEVLPLPDEHGYDEALFIRQLEAAEIVENESAKQQFFNYEVLARDVADKADPVEIKTLKTLEAEVHAIWELGFNGANLDPQTGRDPQLHTKVMEGIRAHYASATTTLPPMSTVHRWGTMHRVVENGDAGWVKHFREIAEAYRA